MNLIKLKKYINLALNNSSEGEASTASKMFFNKLKSMDVKFNPSNFGLSRLEAVKLANLAGKIFKGLNDGAVKTENKNKSSSVQKQEETKNWKIYGRTKFDCCSKFFDEIDMNDSKIRKATIDRIVSIFGFNKPTVQSYASNYRKMKK
jgi:hypothetical protein